MNSVFMIGRLTKNPEIRFGVKGTAITNFTIAVDRIIKKEGNSSVDFFRVVTFGKIAEAVANNITKGNMIGVKGRLQNRSYENKDNIKITITEIIASEIKFLEKKSSDDILVSEESFNYPEEFN